jgi:hypothetical protein
MTGKLTYLTNILAILGTIALSLACITTFKKNVGIVFFVLSVGLLVVGLCVSNSLLTFLAGCCFISSLIIPNNLTK